MIRLNPSLRGDGELARIFAEAADAGERDAAFAELVRRHGPMVLGVCRRLVGNAADADDAAQAVFLTLAHKAAALAAHPSLGGWLHRVARHVALRQREAQQARRRHERVANTVPPAVDRAWAIDLREEIDGALDRLGERYRQPLVLHYLEGRSQDEVARALGLRPGTLASLLSRGRNLLRDQLQRRGLVPGDPAAAGGAVTGVLAGLAPIPALAGMQLPGMARCADLVAAGQAAADLPPHILSLTQGALATMTIAKLKIAAVLAAAVFAVGGVAGRVATMSAGEAPVATAPPAPQVPAAVPAQGGPESAVTGWIAALRANDLGAAMALLPAEQRARMEREWKANAERGNRWQNQFIDSQLGALQGPEGSKLIAQFLAPMLAQAVRAAVADGGGPRGPLGAGGQGLAGGVAGAVLAEGLETRQVQALRPYFEDLTAWLPGAGLDDPAKATAASTHLAAAIKALGIASSADLGALALDELLARGGGSVAELKAALLAFGIGIDQALDSATVVAEPGDGETRSVLLSFTAMGKPYAIPLKVVSKDARWTVVADSPLLAWLRGGGGPRMRMGGPPGGRNRGNRGQGQPDAEPPAAPAPGGVPAKPGDEAF